MKGFILQSHRHKSNLTNKHGQLVISILSVRQNYYMIDDLFYLVDYNYSFIRVTLKIWSIEWPRSAIASLIVSGLLI
jgi:hypothetical protein